MKVLNFGSLNLDYVYAVDEFVQPGETRSCLGRQVHCGGKGLNQSIAMARAGLEVWHAGINGEEGGILRQALAESGVHLDYLRQADSPSGHAIIQVNRRGQNCILLYPGTNAELTEEFVDEVISSFDFGDVVLLQNETNLGPYIMRKAAERGLFIAFNASPIPGVENYPLEFVYWLFINEIEGAALSGETEPKAILRALREKYPRTQVILTLGGDGSYWDDGRETVFCPACHVQAVDTTAAGDTFTGFFLRGVLGEDCGLAPLTLATCASGIAVTRPGAAPSVPTLAEVLASPIRPE